MEIARTGMGSRRRHLYC